MEDDDPMSLWTAHRLREPAITSATRVVHFGWLLENVLKNTYTCYPEKLSKYSVLVMVPGMKVCLCNEEEDSPVLWHTCHGTGGGSGDCANKLGGRPGTLW